MHLIGRVESMVLRFSAGRQTSLSVFRNKFLLHNVCSYSIMRTNRTMHSIYVWTFFFFRCYCSSSTRLSHVQAASHNFCIERSSSNYILAHSACTIWIFYLYFVMKHLVGSSARAWIDCIWKSMIIFVSEYQSNSSYWPIIILFCRRLRIPTA